MNCRDQFHVPLFPIGSVSKTMLRKWKKEVILWLQLDEDEQSGIDMDWTINIVLFHWKKTEDRREVSIGSRA